MKRSIFLIPLVILLVSLACVSLPTPTPPTPPPPDTPTVMPPPPIEVTNTPEPTEGFQAPTLTPEPTFTATPTVTPTPYYAVQAQPASYLPNFTHPEKSCDWMGVGGQVFDLDGRPVQNWTVMVTGVVNGEMRQWLALTGLEPAFGVGGYEIELGTAPLATSGAFTVQLLNTDGQPLSEPVPFDTHADCTGNLVVINFVQVQPLNTVFIPIITR